MADVTQHIDISGAFPDSARMEVELRGAELRSVVGNAIAQVVKDNFIQLNNERTHGYRSPGFYEMAARSTGYTEEYGYYEVVVMWRGVAQRAFGGTIRPTTGKYLAIPNSFSSAIAQIYGKSPREVGNLKVAFGRQADGSIGPIGLKANDEGAVWQHHVRTELGFYVPTGDRGKKIRLPGGTVTKQGRTATGQFTVGTQAKGRSRSSAGEILFWLKKEVYQAADSRVLPPHEALEAAGADAARQWLSTRTPTTITVEGTRVL